MKKEDKILPFGNLQLGEEDMQIDDYHMQVIMFRNNVPEYQMSANDFYCYRITLILLLLDMSSSLWVDCG